MRWTSDHNLLIVWVETNKSNVTAVTRPIAAINATNRIFTRTWLLRSGLYYRKSARLSVCRLSVTLVHPTQTVESFGNFFTAVYLGHPLTSVRSQPSISGGSRGDAAASPSVLTKMFWTTIFGHCGETADQIRMPFGVVDRTDPGMGQVVRLGDRSKGRGTFGGEFRARHWNQYEVYGAATRPSSQITFGLL